MTTDELRQSLLTAPKNGYTRITRLDIIKETKG